MSIIQSQENQVLKAQKPTNCSFNCTWTHPKEDKKNKKEMMCLQDRRKIMSPSQHCPKLIYNVQLFVKVSCISIN